MKRHTSSRQFDVYLFNMKEEVNSNPLVRSKGLSGGRDNQSYRLNQIFFSIPGWSNSNWKLASQKREIKRYNSNLSSYNVNEYEVDMNIMLIC